MPRRGGGMRGGSVRRTRRRRRRRRIVLVGGLVAFGTYKMSTRDAERVKEYTGTDPEELTDAELSQAMDQLGIEKQTVTAQDREQGSAAPAAAAAPGTGGEPDYIEELEKLGQLRDAGVLTEDEFNAKKRQILGL